MEIIDSFLVRTSYLQIPRDENVQNVTCIARGESKQVLLQESRQLNIQSIIIYFLLVSIINSFVLFHKSI